MQPITCSECGLPITDKQDIEYTLDTAGNVTATMHSAAFHEEAALEDERAMESEIHLWNPYAIAEREAAKRRPAPRTFTNRYGLAGKVIAGVAADTDQPIAWVVSDAHSPNLLNIAEWLQRFNGQTIRLTLEHDITLD